MSERPEDLKEQPLPQLLKQLSQETTTLLKKEIELAKAEVRESGKKAGIGAGMFGAAGIAGLMALFAFTLFLIDLIGQLFDSDKFWLGALIVAIVYGVIAGVLALQGKNKVQQATPPAPQTVETVKEDVEWAKHPTKSAGR